ncbi:ABC transporter, ATP-binding protein [Lachnospiraceae bacterium TWA4]|nr:ABC transporter, ATP-binding protein [Lachnospiraceae bacterium TWA4]
MIDVQNVDMEFKKKKVLDNISMKIESGTYGLLGPNGSGKTTLMRCITGILHPTKGKIEITDKIGYLPQKFGTFKQLTVYETLEYFATLKKVLKCNQKDEIYKCLEQVHLLNHMNDKVKTLSGGMVRRVGIAQALLGNPKVILFDEPTTGLDPEERLRFYNLITSMEKDKTIIISTHIVEDVDFSCNHIIILDHGRVLTKSTSEELRNCVHGKIYTFPMNRKSEICNPYILIKEDVRENTIRIFSNEVQSGTIVLPTVEDGYMSFIKGGAIDC